MNDITIRFLSVYEYFKSTGKVKNATAFTEKIGISTSLFTEICNKRSNVGLKAIQNLLKEFQEINPKWLLNGDEKMLNSESLTFKKPFKQDLNTNNTELIKELLNTKDGLINSQQETITAQQKLIKELEEKIKLSR